MFQRCLEQGQLLERKDVQPYVVSRIGHGKKTMSGQTDQESCDVRPLLLLGWGPEVKLPVPLSRAREF